MTMRVSVSTSLPKIIAAGVVALTLAACQDDYSRGGSRHWVAMSPELVATMNEKGMTRSDPILIRSYKQESELEVWKKGRDGKYALLKTFPICRWSGQLGPKVREGDRQAPEGFYPISPAQMNPNSQFHLSFDTGFPNAFDRQLGRSGSFLMVHGACSSRGCFSMTDKQIEDIYALVRDAQSGGQRAVQMQSLPFRMTAANLAKHRFNPHIAFWKNLKEGSDYFEVTGQEPRVTANGGRYVFNAPEGSQPGMPDEVRVALQRKQADDNARVAELVRAGAPAVKVVYADGGQHPSFGGTALAFAGGSGVESLMSVASGAASGPTLAMSRPDAIGAEREVPIGPDGKPLPTLPLPAKPEIAVAAATSGRSARPAAASAAADAVAAAPASSRDDKGMMGRLLGSIGSLGGVLGVGAAAPEPLREEMLPLPPRRNAALGGAPAHGDVVALRAQQ
jgi:murein L,D-transpeptidase YafK